MLPVEVPEEVPVVPVAEGLVLVELLPRAKGVLWVVVGAVPVAAEVDIVEVAPNEVKFAVPKEDDFK